MSIDGEIAIVGTANLDTQSWNQSRELNLVVLSPEVTRAWDQSVIEGNFARAVPLVEIDLDPKGFVCDGKAVKY